MNLDSEFCERLLRELVAGAFCVALTLEPAAGHFDPLGGVLGTGNRLSGRTAAVD